MRSFSRLLTVLAVVGVASVASGCARKLTLLSAALAAPTPPAHNLRMDNAAAAANAKPTAVALPGAAPREASAPQAAAPRNGQSVPAAIEPTPTNALGTSGSSSVVSVRPDEAASAVTVKTTAETKSARKRQVIGATLVAAALVVAVRFVPRRR